MKTVLPVSIQTIEQAKVFLTDLYNNGESYHPEDDAHDCMPLSVATAAECDQLNKLMEEIYDLPGNDGSHGNDMAFCPCGFLLSLDPDYNSGDNAEYHNTRVEQKHLAMLNETLEENDDPKIL
jgi:hypothetical protein